MHTPPNWLVSTILAAATALAASPAGHAGEREARIALAEAWIEAQRVHKDVPGAAVAIVQGDTLVWSRGFGMADRETGPTVTADTAFRVCSISKLFTGIAVMDLVEEGQLDLDTPLSAYLPWFDLDEPESLRDQVTLRSILSHVSGLPEELDLPYYIEIDFPDFATVQQEVPTLSLLQPPFTRHTYSNLGFVLASAAVAAADETDFATAIDTRILFPLGMTATAADLSLLSADVDTATGYSVRGDTGRTAFDAYPTRDYAAAGGFLSSANDLAKLARWIFRLRQDGGEEILSEPTLRNMMRVHWAAPDLGGSARGLAFGFYNLGGQTFVGHGGYCPGYRSLMIVEPDREIAVIVLMNVNDASPYTWASAIYNLVAPGLGDTAPANDDLTAGLETYAGIYDRIGMPERVAVAAAGETLLAIDLFSDNPAGSLWRLEQQGPDAFRSQEIGGRRFDVRFDRNADGLPIRYWRYSNYLIRVPEGNIGLNPMVGVTV